MTTISPGQVRAALQANRSIPLTVEIRTLLQRTLGFPLKQRELSEKCIHAVAGFQIRSKALSVWPEHCPLWAELPKNLGILDEPTLAALNAYDRVLWRSVGMDEIELQNEANALYVATSPDKARVREVRQVLALPTFDTSDTFLTAAILHTNHLCGQPPSGLLEGYRASVLSCDYAEGDETNRYHVGLYTYPFLSRLEPQTALGLIAQITNRLIMLQTGKRTPIAEAYTMTCANPEWNGVLDTPGYRLHGSCVVPVSQVWKRLIPPTPVRPTQSSMHPHSRHQASGGVMSGLCAGPILSSQQSGHLANLLRAIQMRDGEGFAKCFTATHTPDQLFSRLDRPAFPIHNGLSPRTEPIGGAHVWESPWLEIIQRALALPTAQESARFHIVKDIIIPATRLVLETELIPQSEVTQGLLTLIADLVMTFGVETVSSIWGSFVRAEKKTLGSATKGETYAERFVKTMRGEARRRGEWIVATSSRDELSVIVSDLDRWLT